jgi:uncharacterized protein (DUF427 family)
MKVKAIWNNQVIAESDKTIIVERNHYFPYDAVNHEFLKKTEHHTICPWKGEASYYSLEVNGQTNENAAWYYPVPKEEAKQIKNYIAFWRGVEVVEL